MNTQKKQPNAGLQPPEPLQQSLMSLKGQMDVQNMCTALKMRTSKPTGGFSFQNSSAPPPPLAFGKKKPVPPSQCPPPPAASGKKNHGPDQGGWVRAAFLLPTNLW
eukprot:CAMPEP_0174364630 /NCGR_PEP_ID=MMETSP0811_2-20130205/73752_1 /TAXON_ID=73025 ORGANISM="Eutreptiella gymnastica-like, Strain CCMP1594" /NCGR_SAMPLE_ID=MMETSP0811_2 /ASSEMBLY_ACC=CAM_ASM_000667 /LENGTH=105 /DNA_ID=CAMNT_0015504485 /DNA_START=71 /DNA_END=385 /DNA_ORIENTATION=-